MSEANRRAIYKEERWPFFSLSDNLDFGGEIVAEFGPAELLDYYDTMVKFEKWQDRLQDMCIAARARDEH